MEIEAKYSLADEQLFLKVMHSDFWSNYAESSFSKEPFSAVYWDTPDAKVAGQMSSLRLRREGKQTVLTMKWPLGESPSEESALTARGEFNVALKDDETENWREIFSASQEARIAVPEMLREAALDDTLCPRYQAEFVRHRRLLNYQGSIIELAIDRGYLRAAGGEESLAELELELLTGEESALQAFCERVEERFGLKKLSLSKFTRLLALEKRMTEA